MKKMMSVTPGMKMIGDMIKEKVSDKNGKKKKMFMKKEK